MLNQDGCVCRYVQRNMWVYWTSLGVMFVCLISLACCESVRRKAPTNFIFLALFTGHSHIHKKYIGRYRYRYLII